VTGRWPAGSGGADVAEPLAASAGGRRPGRAGVPRGGRGQVPAEPRATAVAGSGAGGRPGCPGLDGGSVLDADPDYRGDPGPVPGGVHAGRGADLGLHCIGRSVQVPARRPAERDEALIAAERKETWPVVKGPRQTQVAGRSSRTSPGRGLRPPHGRGWAGGATPVVKVRGGRVFHRRGGKLTRKSSGAALAAVPSGTLKACV
jgi:hypothetical protein